MNRLAVSFGAFLRVAVAHMLQYRAEIALWALWGVVSPAVLMAVWSAAAASASRPGSIAGRSTGELMAYFFMTMVVGHMATAWDVYEMGWLVRSGRMSPRLLKPILPIWESLADNLAYKLVTLVILIPIWTVIALLVRPTFQTSLRDAALAAIALLMSAALSFVWGYCVGCAAFFVTKMDAIAELWFGFNMFFGGRLAPIGLLPWPLGHVAAVLPCRWIVAFPSELMAGQLSARDAWTGLLWQAAWLVVGIAIFRAVWYRGVRRYSAVGA